ncbi:tetraacyldisaccharide 4'-kinase [Flammeovirga sp. MY04]|uniref:tetraacyldisaccharide 4'-kinase n=1 Tax=Flammeovirga sp. MY04 TaxID=1191459 RepID=UPI0008064373|nr:tetraacyldisaccharide 4'-kinase [Flammeovirga sp. MY04]ANQ48529.1 tetraacyldisaccharide 4'-kinase [Flammeovirga sp. MY04]
MEFILKPLSKIYDAITHQRNKSYDSKPFKTFKFDIPMINVGNLSVGGTGKTPFVEFLIQKYQEEYNVGVLSRGYGRKTKGPIKADQEATSKSIGDEPMQYHSKYDKVEVVVAEERVFGVPLFENTDLVLLDDAFQHRGIHRDVNIMLSDFNAPFFDDHVLPYGRLRERREGANRADIIIFTKCPDSLDIDLKKKYTEKAKNYSKAEVFFTSIKYDKAYFLKDNTEVEIPSNINLLTSIANPKPLIEHLEKINISVDHHFKFRDHYSFTEKTIARVESESKTNNILITEKDAAKLKSLTKESNFNYFVLPITPHVLFDEEDSMMNKINSLLKKVND